MFLSREIRTTPFPDRFQIAFGVEKYDGNSRRETWLDDYLIAIQIGGGDEFVAMRNLSLMLEGSARAWL